MRELREEIREEELSPSFSLNYKKKWLINQMRNPTAPHYDCCPLLERCDEKIHSCYLPEYASNCYYRINKMRR